MQRVQKNLINVGFIGNGKSTNRYHMPFVLSRPEKFCVKRIYDRSFPKVKWTPISGVSVSADIRDVLEDPEIDLIVVTTPTEHGKYARMVLESGKHCIVEKPFCHTRAEAEQLFALAEEKGLMLQCYQNRRFDSDYLTAQQVLASGKLGQLQEVEMHFDYYRPEIPEAVKNYSVDSSYVYGHACHTLDQVIAWFGTPDSVHYDVRQLLGKGRMNDYFDIDLMYGGVKVSVKSSYFRLVQRPSFVLYGTKGVFVKEKKDRQEEHLKMFYMPDHSDFGRDRPEDYGTLTYMDADGGYHEEKVPTVPGDYARYYDAVYETLVRGMPQLVRKEQTLLQLSMLEEAVSGLV